MRSFVLWYEKRENDSRREKPEIEIHVNLWKVQKNIKEEFIFDFGFLISDITLVKDIYFYVPFKVEEHKDLGEKVLRNHQLAGAIFNEMCNISTVRVGKRINIKTGESETLRDFMFYSLGSDQIEVSDVNDNHYGNLLILHLGNILSANEISQNMEIENIKNYYFRFRMKTNKKNLKLVRNQDFDQSIFSNAFTRTEIIDFRINDIRTCSEQIKEKYGSNHKFNIKKINYLLLRNFNDEFIYHDGNVKSRILENDLWDAYIEELHEDLIAYHIKKIAKNKNNDIDYIESFVSLARFKYQKSNFKIILKYLLILLVSSIFTGIMSTILYEKFIK